MNQNIIAVSIFSILSLAVTANAATTDTKATVINREAMMVAKRQSRLMSSMVSAPASTTPAPYLSKVFNNTAACAKNSSCDLKNFKLEVYKSSSIQDQLDKSANDLIYSDMMVASYETKDIGSLEEFVIVQFVRGCNYQEQKVNGKTVVSIGSTRSLFDFESPFIHPNWVVDSIDADPTYSSVPYDPSLYSSIPISQWKRHAAYRVHKPNPFANETPVDQAVFQNENPATPVLYISDYPSPSYAGPERKDPSRTTMSLNFKTCVFKASDVPTKTDPSWTGSGKEIACFNWQNAHQYDAGKDRFVDTAKIDPRCEDQKWADEAFIEDATPPLAAPIDWTKTSLDYKIANNSCDALLGERVSPTTYFAGDICKADLDHSRDYSHFSELVNLASGTGSGAGAAGGPREIPSTFMVRRLQKQGQASIDFSALHNAVLPEMGAIFHEIKQHALDVVSKHASPQNDVDQAMVARLQSLNVQVLPQGAGCDDGFELYAGYDAVMNQIQICPAWSHLPSESWVEMFSNNIADTLDVCSFRPIYSMTPALFNDEKLNNPDLVHQCFKNDPDLGNITIISLVNSRLEPLADAGISDFETIQVDLDSALLKCGLITPRVMPTQFTGFLTQDMWTCGRSHAGDAAPTAPITQPWRDTKACGGRVRDVIEGTYGSDLMAYYLRQHPDVLKADSKTSILYSARKNSCAQQGLQDPRGLDSQERLGLYLAKPEILNGMGCQVTSAPQLCESTLFTSP